MTKVVNREPVTLLVDSAKKEAFLNAMKLYDFVIIETFEQRLKRYLATAPKSVPFSDDDIMREINIVRKKLKK